MGIVAMTRMIQDSSCLYCFLFCFLLCFKVFLLSGARLRRVKGKVGGLGFGGEWGRGL
jgi:hypothetical protein